MSPEKKAGSLQSNTAVIADKICRIIYSSGLDEQVKQRYLRRLSDVDTGKLEQTFAPLSGKLTALDMKYIICFHIDMAVGDISDVFNIEPASVYTVRYRIRKKFRSNALLDMFI